MIKKFICTACVQDQKQSIVHEHNTTTDSAGILPFFDNDGNRHYHDKNARRTILICENGHYWSVTHYNECWCGWKGGDTAVSPL